MKISGSGNNKDGWTKAKTKNKSNLRNKRTPKLDDKETAKTIILRQKYKRYYKTVQVTVKRAVTRTI